MNIQLKPDLAKFIEDQVKAGRYGSSDDAINAAVARIQAEEQLLAEGVDDKDLTAIEEGLAQANRGEGQPWTQVREGLRAKYLSK